MKKSLRGQTDIAAFSIGLNVMEEGRLVVVYDNQLTSFFDSRIAC